MEKKTVSIIVPVYNVEKYIVECLDSISAQTYKGHIECILVDDCSTDNSVNVIRHYIEENRNHVDFQVILQQKNQRQGIARNVGMQKSSGDYILFVDSDDVIASDCLETMFGQLEKYPNADYVLCGMKDMDGNISYSPIGYPEYVDDKKWLLRKSLFPEGGIPPGPVNKLIRKSLIVENDISFPGKVIYEDVQFSFLLGVYAKAVCFCEKTTYYYRTNREGSTVTTTARNLALGLESRITLLCNMLDRVVADNVNVQVRALFARFLLYLKITDTRVLDQYEKQLLGVQSRILTKMPMSMSWMIAKLPLQLLRNKHANKLFYKLINNS